MRSVRLAFPAPRAPIAAACPWIRRATLSAILVIASLSLLPVHAHLHGMYASKAEAEKRAAQLKCHGVFAMGNLWMPCANERALHEALLKAP